MEARAARFDEEDQLKKLRTQVQSFGARDLILICHLESSRTECQA